MSRSASTLAWLAIVAGLLPPAAAIADEGRGLFQVWTPRGRPPAVALETLPLRDGARAAVAREAALRDDPVLPCGPPGMPAMLDTAYPVEFVDQGERIIMRYEQWNGRRTIHMRPRNLAVAGRASPQGESFGRWEGETLAIFTTHIDYPYFDDRGTPQSADVSVLERYTPNHAATRLDWTAIVTDPATFTAAVVRSGYFVYEPGTAIGPSDCTPPNDGD